MGSFWSRLRDLFFSKKLECVLVGLENSGKSTFCTYLEMGPNSEETVPTVGMNVKLVKRQGVSFKVWDIGGQNIFRDEWGRYCKGCDVIIFVVDTNDVARLPEAKIELHRLLESHELNKIPVLILANKVDIAKISSGELIKSMSSILYLVYKKRFKFGLCY